MPTLVPVPIQPGTGNGPGNSLNDFYTDYWVKHAYYPREGPSINYRLQYVIESCTDHNFIAFFESQSRDADVNICIQNTFAPMALDWRGPLLVMKQKPTGECLDCKESDIYVVIDAIEKSVSIKSLLFWQSIKLPHRFIKNKRSVQLRTLTVYDI